MPKRTVWLIAAAAAVLVLIGGGVLIALATRDDKPPVAAPVTSAPPEARPPASSPPPAGADIEGPLDVLLIGADTRVTIPDWEPHADTIMLLHLERGLKSGYLYSLPRDLRVSMPAFPAAGFPGGQYKITEAMSRGSRVPGSNRPNAEQGYQLLQRVVGGYTGIGQFDAGAVLTFTGMSRLTDALGGITMGIDQKVLSQHRTPDGKLRPMSGGSFVGPQATYLPGKRTLNGWQALDYARQRYGLKNGDYDRQRHHRQLVSALLAKAFSARLGTDQAKLNAVIKALGDTLIYSGRRSTVEFAYALRNLEPTGITMLSLPGSSVMSGGGYLGEQLKPLGRNFLKAVAAGNPRAFVAAHPELRHR